jgi:hypothetical protein
MEAFCAKPKSAATSKKSSTRKEVRKLNAFMLG